MHLSQQRIKTLIEYDPETGEVFLLSPTVRILDWNCISIRGVAYSLDRLLFLYMEGVHPSDRVDIIHLDGNMYNNRWDNLEKSSKEQIGVKEADDYYKNKVYSSEIAQSRAWPLGRCYCPLTYFESMRDIFTTPQRWFSKNYLQNYRGDRLYRLGCAKPTPR